MGCKKKSNIKTLSIKIEACKIILREDSFTNEMIKEEYVFNCNEGSFRIDVVGISKEKRVAFECGNTDLKKMMVLEKYFDWVIHVPYCHSWLLYPKHYSLWRIYSYACPDTYKLWGKIDTKRQKILNELRLDLTKATT